MALSSMEDASIPLTKFIICILYLLTHIITWLELNEQISSPIFKLLFRFLEQLSHTLWYLYWVAPWGESVHAGSSAAGRSTGACRTGATHNASSATNSAKARLNATNKTSNQRRKRKRKDDEEDEPPDRKAKLDPEQPSSPFACPFYLHDRHECYHCLRNYTLNRIVDVRLHLLRIHLLAPQCPISETANLCHLLRRLDMELQETSSKPYKQVPERNGRRVPDPAAEKWFEMWDIIFPRATRPVSPYIRDHPDVQRIRDMTEYIFSGEGWRDVILLGRETSPSLQIASQSTLEAVAEGFIAVFRRMYQDLDRPAPEATANAVADTPVASSMDDSLQQRHGWEVLSAPSQPAQATENHLTPASLAPAATGQDPWILEQQHGRFSLDVRSHNDPVIQVSQALSSFTPELDFLSDAQVQEPTFDFQDIVDSFEDPVRSGSPSQFLNDDYQPDTSGFWSHQGGGNGVG